MPSDKLKKIESLFHSALELKAKERETFLSDLKEEDSEVYSEVLSLLAFEEESEDFIEESAAEIVAKNFSEELNGNFKGKKIGSYKIESFIGEGGMGKVFSAVDERLNRRVALKILSTKQVFDEEYLQRFEIEARAASTLNHPQILTIYEFGKTEDLYFIAAELVEGKTLRELITENELKLPAILKIVIQTAEALNAAHEAEILHRDIKPENIMIRKDGYAKVLDFGLAKLTEKAALEKAGKNLTTFRTKTGRVLGTPNYMSPEQIRGQKVDRRTDIFSLGVLLYELVSHRQPFAENSANATIAAILLDEPNFSEDFDSDVPPELVEIVNTALKKDAENRYQTMDEMIADLKQLQNQLQFESLHDTFGSGKTVIPSIRRKKVNPAFFGRYKFPLACAAVILLSLAGLGFYFFSNNQSKTIKSIAVMPFVDSGANSEVEYLADGLTESVIDRLSKLSDVKVMSFNSVSRFKNESADARTLGRELGVEAVLFTRLKQNGEDISINTELVSVEDNSRIWSYQYSGKNADLLAMQESISNEISEKLNLKLSGADKNVLAKKETQNAEAFQLYLKGRFFWNKRTGENLKKAIEFFNQAIEKDPSYALAYVGLADCYGLLSNYTDTPSSESMPKAKAAALKALQIDDPTGGSAHIFGLG